MVFILSDFINKIIFYGIGYGLVIIASELVVFIIKRFEIVDDESLKGAGKIIGILERILVITLVYIKEFQAITIIFAAKSIIRFERIKNRDGRRFAEYFLIGTLTSLIIAIFTGIMINFIIENVNLVNYLIILFN